MADDATEIQKGICAGAACALIIQCLKYLLFPDKDYIQQYGLQMSPEDVASRWQGKGETRPRANPDPIPITLIGCVDYTYPISPIHHQTGFAFDVLMEDRRLGT